MLLYQALLLGNHVVPLWAVGLQLVLPAYNALYFNKQAVANYAVRLSPLLTASYPPAASHFPAASPRALLSPDPPLLCSTLARSRPLSAQRPPSSPPPLPAQVHYMLELLGQRDLIERRVEQRTSYTTGLEVMAWKDCASGRPRREAYPVEGLRGNTAAWKEALGVPQRGS